MRLGKVQLLLMKSLGTTSAQIVPCKRTRRLVELGLLEAEPDGSFARMTSNGLRALADAVDAGKIDLFNLDRAKAKH